MTPSKEATLKMYELLMKVAIRIVRERQNDNQQDKKG